MVGTTLALLASVDLSHPIIVKTKSEQITKGKRDCSNTKSNHLLEKNYSLWAGLMFLDVHYSMNSLLSPQFMYYSGNK